MKQLRNTSVVVQADPPRALAFVAHHSLTVRSEGEEWQMDFASEIDDLAKALERLGIDTGQGLITPMKRDDEDDE
ncbi:hypothetical protein OKW30_007623 [Paraburkholderia sp. Clong3]|uniref:hypothetical protein n=1 Tax=Paraburkholderia sp. Clong3 TaxID=2991061 RepID=UPI003D1DEC7F